VFYDFQENPPLAFTEQVFRSVVNDKYPPSQAERIFLALELAKKYHQGQYRADGSPYAVHPIRVALLLLEHENPMPDVLITALLHDILEETSITEAEVADIFGEPVITYLRAVTSCRSDNETSEERKERKLKKWQATMNEKLEVRIVKVFDNLDNMICWKFINPNSSKAKKIPRWLMQARDMFLPLAKITNNNAYRLFLDELTFYLSKGYKIGDWHSDS
jgi:guanosine-3',5'-bis(diphosphate) 3'-pyrophosphohydrolase